MDGGDWRVIKGLLRCFQMFQDIVNVCMGNGILAESGIEKRQNLPVVRKRTVRLELTAGVDCFGEDSAQAVTKFGGGQFCKCDNQNFRDGNALQQHPHKENLDVVGFSCSGPGFDKMVADQ